MRFSSSRIVFIPLLLLVLFTQDEPIPRIEVKGGTTPTFSVSQEPIVHFEVCCQRELEPSDEDNYLWRIEKNHSGKSTPLPFEIVYGVVPEGWRQTIPEEGMKPLQLSVGRKYSFIGRALRGGGGCFEIREGKASELDCAYEDVQIEGGIKDGAEMPTFNINGTDSFFELSVFYDEDDPNKDMGKRARIIAWSIRPSAEYKRRLPIEIVYGNLPEGYSQRAPRGKAEPEKLKSGIKYFYQIRGLQSGASGCFEMVEGKVCKVGCYYTERCKK